MTMKTQLVTYSLELDEYMSTEADEDRYDVVRIELWHKASGPELNTIVEYENCTLAQAAARIHQLLAARFLTEARDE